MKVPLPKVGRAWIWKKGMPDEKVLLLTGIRVVDTEDPSSPSFWAHWGDGSKDLYGGPYGSRWPPRGAKLQPLHLPPRSKGKSP